MPRSSFPALFVVALGVSLAACSSKETEEAAAVVSVQEDKAIAYVDDTPITARELEVAKGRFKVNPALMDDRFNDTLLESLVSSRAMSLLAEAELAGDELELIDSKVSAYREELLVKEYLQRHAQPNPVSEEMVKNYYDRHPEEFSGGVRKEFEYYSTNQEFDEEGRKRILAFLSSAKEAGDWKKRLDGEGQLPLLYRKTKARVSMLDEPLKTLVASTLVDQVSSVHMGEQIMIVRVLSEETIPARPLREVSAEIRKKLAPMQLREAIRKVSEQALSEVKVRYPGT